MGTLDTVQQEQLEAIGTYLSQIREGQARTLEEISAKTYIPMRLLKAIESGQGKTLPEPVFIQGFIRRYADALGLDGVDLSQKFPVNITPLPVMAAPGAPRSAPAKTGPAASREFRAKETASSPSVSPTEDLDGTPRSRSLMPYVAGVALLAIGGMALAMVQNLSSRQPSPPKQSVVLPPQPSPNGSSANTSTAPTVAPSPASSPAARISPSPATTTSQPAASPTPATRNASPTASPSPANQTAASPSRSSNNAASNLNAPATNPATNAPVNVELQTTDEAWVQVIVDGQVKAEGILPRGTRQTWTGNREVTVVAGNAGAVSVIHNGRSPKPLGAAGAVSEMTFKPEARPN